MISGNLQQIALRIARDHEESRSHAARDELA
jgi:hypothetical protein